MLTLKKCDMTMFIYDTFHHVIILSEKLARWWQFESFVQMFGKKGTYSVSKHFCY